MRRMKSILFQLYEHQCEMVLYMKTWQFFFGADVGTWTTMLPSGGSLKDLCWLQSWWARSMCAHQIDVKKRLVTSSNVCTIVSFIFCRSTLCSSSASSSFLSKSFSHLTSVETSPVFTCEYFYLDMYLSRSRNKTWFDCSVYFQR